MTIRHFLIATGAAALASSIASAQSISAGFTGTGVVSSSTGNNGSMFDFVALNPAGLIIDSFDVHSRATAGTLIDVEVWYKSGTFVGFETDPSAWTLLGSVNVSAGGPLNPTPVALGGIVVSGGQTLGLYFNAVTEAAAIRYNTAATTPTTAITNDDAAIHVEFSSGIGGQFGPSIFTPRGANGTVYYTVIPAPGALSLLAAGAFLAVRRRR